MNITDIQHLLDGRGEPASPPAARWRAILIA